MLLVIVILSALLSISIGIFNVIFGELRISGEVADSFIALYAADRGMERTLYRDRVLGDTSVTNGESTVAAESSDGCYAISVGKSEVQCGTGVGTCIVSTGQYRCGLNPARLVRRRFIIDY